MRVGLIRPASRPRPRARAVVLEWRRRIVRAATLCICGANLHARQTALEASRRTRDIYAAMREFCAAIIRDL